MADYKDHIVRMLANLDRQAKVVLPLYPYICCFGHVQAIWHSTRGPGGGGRVAGEQGYFLTPILFKCSMASSPIRLPGGAAWYVYLHSCMSVLAIITKQSVLPCLQLLDCAEIFRRDSALLVSHSGSCKPLFPCTGACPAPHQNC